MKIKLWKKITKKVEMEGEIESSRDMFGYTDITLKNVKILDKVKLRIPKKLLNK